MQNVTQKNAIFFLNSEIPEKKPYNAYTTPLRFRPRLTVRLQDWASPVFPLTSPALVLVVAGLDLLGWI